MGRKGGERGGRQDGGEEQEKIGRGGRARTVGLTCYRLTHESSRGVGMKRERDRNDAFLYA